MKLLVTGGAGFIGSHLIRRWLAARPQDTLVNFDRLTYAGSPERLADVASSPRYRFVQGDICDRTAVREAMAGCALVIHAAAETHVDRSIADAAPFLRTNVEGTYQVLQAAHEAGVERVVHVSTDEVYGPVIDGAVDERAPLSPRSPYAASKAGGDLLAQAFYHTHRTPVIVARPTNVYGPWQLPEKLIPLAVANVTDGLPVPVYGQGQQRRNWLFVGDLCDALRLIAERGAIGGVYNIGSGHEQPNLETVRAILTLMGASDEAIRFVPDRPGHDWRYAMQDANVRALGWRPATTFAAGLADTVAWYQAHAGWWRPIVRRLREDSCHWLNGTAGASAPHVARAGG